MKIRILLGIIGLFSFAANAQNVIRIRPQHQIEHIYTLKEGERFYTRESQLDFKYDGVDYSFRTTHKGNQYLHENGKSKKTLSSNAHIWYYPNRYKNCRITKNERLLTVEHHQSGKSYGPFNWGRFMYNEKLKPTRFNSNYTTASNLYAFLYYVTDNSDTTIAIYKRERFYYIVIPGDVPLGPFQKATIYKATADELIYSYRNEEGEYLYENGTVHGPFEDLIYATGNEERPLPRTENGMHFYAKNGLWYASHPDLESYSFSSRPIFRSNYYWANVVELDNQKCRIYTNGELLMDTHDKFYIMNWYLDELEFTKVNLENQRDFSLRYEVRYKDSLLGVFSTVNSVRLLHYYTHEKDHFWQGLKKCDTLANEDLTDEGIYFFSPVEGFIGPYQDKRGVQVSFSGKTTASYSYQDSTLKFQDGRFYDHVVAADFTDPGGDWWMLIREGYYDQPYKNGVKYSGNKLPNSFLSYRTPDKAHVIVFKGGEQFVKSKYSNKLFGPVSPRSEIAISKDATNYAEGLRAGNVILINERAISEGFNLVYNDKLDAFHWINIDEKNRVYLHTYELN